MKQVWSALFRCALASARTWSATSKMPEPSWSGRACTSSWMSTRGCSRSVAKISGAPGTSIDRSLVYWMLSASGATPGAAPGSAWTPGGGGEEASDMAGTSRRGVLRGGSVPRRLGVSAPRSGPNLSGLGDGNVRRAPGDARGRRLGGVAPQPLPVVHPLARHGEYEAPVGHHQRFAPVGQGRHFGAEFGGAGLDLVVLLLVPRPPDLVDGGEVVVGPGDAEIGAGGAHVAGEGVALADARRDRHGQAEPLGHRRRGLQGAGVGRADDAPDRLRRERLGRRFRLPVPEFGELRVVDAGVAARGREMQVELALPVSQQDHRGVRRGGWGSPARRRGAWPPLR